MPTAWKAFRQHCELTFGGPLKRKSEEEKFNYLMIWIGDKDRDIYNTWKLTAEGSEETRHVLYKVRNVCEAQIKQSVCKVQIPPEGSTRG